MIRDIAFTGAAVSDVQRARAFYEVVRDPNGDKVVLHTSKRR